VTFRDYAFDPKQQSPCWK